MAKPAVSRGMKFAALTLALVALTGCYVQEQYGEPLPVERVHAALERWHVAGHKITARCMTEADKLTIEFADKALLDAECPGNSDIIGCTAAGTDWDGERHTSFLMRDDLEGQKLEDTIEHELRHWLAECTYGDSDHDHGNAAVWFEYEGRDVR